MQSIGPRAVARARSFQTHLGGGGPHMPVLVSRPKSFRAFTHLLAIATIGVLGCMRQLDGAEKERRDAGNHHGSEHGHDPGDGRRGRQHAVDRDDQECGGRADRYGNGHLCRRQRAAGTLSATSVKTNASGQASTTWTLGKAPGIQTVTATAGALAGGDVSSRGVDRIGHDDRQGHRRRADGNCRQHGRRLRPL